MGCPGWHTAMKVACKDYCGSTVLAMPESEGMVGTKDWQAQQTSHLGPVSWRPTTVK